MSNIYTIHNLLRSLSMFWRTRIKTDSYINSHAKDKNVSAKGGVGAKTKNTTDHD